MHITIKWFFKFIIIIIITMFALSVFVLSVALFAQADVINPYALIDEVTEQVDELRSIVRGAIYSAFDDLDSLIRDLYYFRDDKLESCRVSIQQNHETLDSELTTLKELAASVNQDIDRCLVDNEPILNDLPQQKIDSLLECLVMANQEVTIIQNDGRYYIDILVNEVDIFNYQINLCDEDFLCLSPLVELIELAMDDIPKKTKIEVEKANDLLKDLQVLIGDCSDSRVAQFAEEGGNILQDITECVNRPTY